MTRYFFFLLCVLLISGCTEDPPIEPEKPPGLKCYFTQPYPMQLFLKEQEVVVIIEAEAISGTVTEVSLLINDSLFETKIIPPYIFTIPAGYLKAGIHQMEAIALHSKELKVSSLLSFSLGLDLPIVKTFVPENITHNQTFCSGEVLADMAAPVTERGFCWSIYPYPLTTDNKKQEGSKIGSFSSYIDGLAPQTTYYVRAYAINSCGTGYGEQQVFTTTNPLPVVETQGDSVVTITTCQWEAQGEVLSEGASPVTERGFCWDIQPHPTPMMNKKLVVGSGTGTFSGKLPILYESTTYYIRAYATNADETAYGKEIQGNRSQRGSAPLIPTILIPAGSFMMGSSLTECGRGAEEAQHQVPFRHLK